MEYKKSKNSINRGLLIAGMLILHQPITYAGWRDDIANIWNKLVAFNQESNIPFIIGSGIAFAAAIYFLRKKGGRGSAQQPPSRLPEAISPQATTEALASMQLNIDQFLERELIELVSGTDAREYLSGLINSRIIEEILMEKMEKEAETMEEAAEAEIEEAETRENIVNEMYYNIQQFGIHEALRLLPEEIKNSLDTKKIKEDVMKKIIQEDLADRQEILRKRVSIWLDNYFILLLSQSDKLYPQRDQLTIEFNRTKREQLLTNLITQWKKNTETLVRELLNDLIGHITKIILSQ